MQARGKANGLSARFSIFQGFRVHGDSADEAYAVAVRVDWGG
jgi:hypothetical protein